MYRLRADTVYGYDHDDWLHTPLVAPDARFDLTAEQIEETLKYFCKFVQRLCAPVLPQLSFFGLLDTRQSLRRSSSDSLA